ncbi:uncharacterized protein M437DRAFT_73579 [Aureobasidium melanogenum CBS 110374]|uniref:Secreted protein n=1 Tax=Aureobasidium melanogenum (strain CBS 110374) TaxID=1043003 RepID=A0A074W429_AURM1|nr:uncharacterized protein M437DRAFT_73579 [Aureobasidium melanogenum CBS 110374]KEQ64642.1 hypothetical protein M437DRAFT_73579 [Aureobasidium melanogenum CBS 110374]
MLCIDFSALTLLWFQVLPACRCKKLAPSDALKPPGSNCLAYCCSLTPNASSDRHGELKLAPASRHAACFLRGCFGTSLALLNQVPMRLESNPHATDCAYCATRWSRSRHITIYAIHASGSSTAGKFKLPGIACGNCKLQQPASMLHDVRVFCL